MIFRLPELQARLPIVDSLGRPLNSFLRFFNIDFRGALERQEAAQAEILAELQAVQATQQDEIDRLNRVLAGTENFTGIQVGGTNVKPFLDKTDGSSIDQVSGIVDGLISTLQWGKQGAPVPVDGPTEVVLAEFDITTTGKPVILWGMVQLAGSNASSYDVTLALYRDSDIVSLSGVQVIETPGGTYQHNEAVVVITVDDDGGAGLPAATHTYSLVASTSGSITSGVGSRGFVAGLELKR